MTAHGLRMTQSNELTKMRPYSHESVLIAEKSVSILFETQARGLTEDKAVIFLVLHRHVMTFEKTI